MLPDEKLLPQAIRMSERSEMQCQNAFVRAEVSGLLSRDKSKSTLLSINEDVPLNGNMGLTAIFKRTYSICRPSLNALRPSIKGASTFRREVGRIESIVYDIVIYILLIFYSLILDL